MEKPWVVLEKLRNIVGPEKWNPDDYEIDLKKTNVHKLYCETNVWLILMRCVIVEVRAIVSQQQGPWDQGNVVRSARRRWIYTPVRLC